VPPWRETEAIDLDDWDAVFAVNVRGVMAAIKHATPLLKREGGTIVAMGSMNSARAHARQCLYTATKHAVLGIVRATALDLGRHGIRVNAVGPGPIATAALLERMRARAASGGPPVEDALRAAGDTALGRMATEDDVANTVLFLASELSGGTTGALVPVDGGLA
jgi:NAD(P)-dependent dehydrogenase (short-subunit alcohol dehydrogenase family)